jgi:hypothetical protein
VLSGNNYDSEPMLRECGISIAREFMQIDGRVLQAPQVGSLHRMFFIAYILCRPFVAVHLIESLNVQLSAARGKELYTSNGRWNFNKDVSN